MSQTQLFFHDFDSFSTQYWTFGTPGAQRPRGLIFRLFSDFGPFGPKCTLWQVQTLLYCFEFYLPPKKATKEDQGTTLGKTKNTVEVGLPEYCWTISQTHRKRPDNRTTSAGSDFQRASDKALLKELPLVHPSRILGFSVSDRVRQTQKRKRFRVLFPSNLSVN